MKKQLSVALAGLLVALSLSACGTSQDPSTTTQPDANGGSGATTLSGRVSTNGSTSMEKVVGALSEAFMQKNGDVSITYDPTGSGSGITAAQEGTADIGLSSRALKEEESQNLNEIVLALDGIAVIVHKNNPLKDLTVEQIGKIATGEVSNWKDVGGADAPIVPIGREAGSGTRDGFESIIDAKDNCKYAQELTATGAVIAAVQANENAIGYASLASVKDTVAMLSVEGVAPSEAAVQDGSYKFQRPFVMVTKKDTPLRTEVQAFIDYALDPANAEIITAAGAVPLAK